MEGGRKREAPVGGGKIGPSEYRNLHTTETASPRLIDDHSDSFFARDRQPNFFFGGSSGGVSEASPDTSG